MPIKFSASILLIAMSLIAPRAGAAGTVSIEPGTDRMGADYKGFALNGADPQACRQACTDDAACKSYTFVKPGVKGPQAMCFLKSGVPVSTANDCCTSGAKTTPANVRMAQPAATPQLHLTNSPPPRSAPTRRQVMQRGPSQLPKLVNTAATVSKDDKLPTAPFIAAPGDVTLKSDIDNIEVKWSWGSHQCFASGGAQPAPCLYIQDIEGFRIYTSAGSAMGTIADPARRIGTITSHAVNCVVVRAYKGAMESENSQPACLDAAKPSPFQTANSIPPPTNLRATTGASDCAAATGGGMMAFVCDMAVKNHVQPLVWTWNAPANVDIDGFRIYDAVNGEAYVVDTKASVEQRVYMAPPLSGVVASDWCFTVRAFRSSLESKSSNQVCLTPLKALPPPKPVKPEAIVISASGGSGWIDIRLRKDFNTGCPWSEKNTRIRTRFGFGGYMQVNFIHQDKNILCGDLMAQHTESGVMFPLNDVPTAFTKATLHFTSNGGYAKVGTEGGFLNVFGNAVTPNVNCTKAVHSYYNAIPDNTAPPAGEYRIGDPSAYFSFLTEDLVATNTVTGPGADNAIDVTALVIKAIKAKRGKLGFVWSTDESMPHNNDACLSSFGPFWLEVEPSN